MIREDYLMRMLQNLVSTFARLVGLKEESPDEARFELEEALGEFFGVRREVLFAQPVETIDRVAPKACAVVGKLFVMHAELARDRDEAELSMQWALRAFERALDEDAYSWSIEAEEELTQFLRGELVARVGSPDRVRQAYEAIFDFAARAERLESAEDALFAAIELGSDEVFRHRGVAFFDSVGGREAAYYDEHGLSAEEVDAIIRELAAS